MKSSSLPPKTKQKPHQNETMQNTTSLATGVACCSCSRSGGWSESQFEYEYEYEYDYQSERKSVECAKCEVPSKDALHASHCAARYPNKQYYSN